MPDGEAEMRPLRPSDAAEACALIRAMFAGTPYDARAMELLELAIGGASGDTAGAEHEGTVVAVAGLVRGIAVHGPVAGAQAGKVHTLILGDARLGSELLGVVRERRAKAGAAMLVCELPDEPAFAIAAEALAGAGFVVEGTLGDFVRDGVALRVFVRRWREDAPPNG